MSHHRLNDPIPGAQNARHLGTQFSGFYVRLAMGTNSRFSGPVYTAEGRMIFPL